MTYRLVRYAGPESRFSPVYAFVDHETNKFIRTVEGRVRIFEKGQKALQWAYELQQMNHNDMDDTVEVFWEGTVW